MHSNSSVLHFVLILSFFHPHHAQVSTARADFAELRFSAACDALLSIATAGNLYLDERAPWSMFKKGGGEGEQAAKVL